MGQNRQLSLFHLQNKLRKYQLWRTDGTSENTLKLDESFRTGFTEPNIPYLIGIEGTLLVKSLLQAFKIFLQLSRQF